MKIEFIAFSSIGALGMLNGENRTFPTHSDLPQAELGSGGAPPDMKILLFAFSSLGALGMLNIENRTSPTHSLTPQNPKGGSNTAQQHSKNPKGGSHTALKST